MFTEVEEGMSRLSLCRIHAAFITWLLPFLPVQVLRPGLKKGQWSDEEDQRLLTQVASGESRWEVIADAIPGRTTKQCKERWYNHLVRLNCYSTFSGRSLTCIW